ncbi:hypothetical protein ACW2QC_09140 [Virgibacillus sp. FSP13]
MNVKIIHIYKYHIITSDEFQKEDLEQVKQFAVFNNRIENEMLGVKWLNPIGDEEGILIKDIVHIKYLGKEEVRMNTEIDAEVEAS